MILSLFPIALVIILFFPYIIAYEFASSVTVDQSGKGQFKTIQDAINSVPSGNNKWFRIHISSGIYNEKVSIPPEKECIYLEGSNLSKPIITSDNHISSESATFRSSANNFVANNIKFVNSYKNVKSAPAAIVYGNKTTFKNCEFIGYRNTLADFKGTHYYRSCYIEGAIDIIWGWGQSFFETCKIKVTSGPNSKGYITAQGRDYAEDSNGFVFWRCDVDGIGQAYLGKAYGSSSRVVFIESNMSSVVIPAGWDAWFHDKAGLTYVEAGCRGSGANSVLRVPWTRIMEYNEKALEQYSLENFVDKDQWIADTLLVTLEKVSISSDKEFIFLEGSNVSKPIISSDIHLSSQSATLNSSANNFVAKNIKFLNLYNIDRKMINVTSSPAATIYGNKTAFYDCEFIGYTNILADFRGSHYYRSCFFEGTSDIIWGWGQSFFEQCKITVIGEPNTKSYITAQGRDYAEDSNGFVFTRCDVDGTGQAYLGRPYGASSRVVFIQSTLSSVVIPVGWDAWMHEGNKDGLTYIEAGCQGSGANSSLRAPFTRILDTKSEALEEFLPDNFTDKDRWISETFEIIA
ncbi:probable pectinesterase 66 [Impatiens glandulifera]|uniref:probable pectinesterase 66 n=1 Tax=Impatiens glandulifera TaxID=253017 RepID=UPI001FB073E6|nr:probable pectinesterase 66 [Impatiens glandulifera]